MDTADKFIAGDNNTDEQLQDSADRTAQKGENKQVRTTRIRKTGRENLIILSAHFSADNKGFLNVKYKSFYIIAYTYGYSPRVL